MIKKKTAYQYTKLSKRTVPINTQDGAKENFLSIYRMEQKKINCPSIYRMGQKIYTNIYNMVQKKIAYQYTEWCKKKQCP